MRLDIVIPGLLWPQDSIASVAQGLDLPALAAMLGRGRIHWLPGRGLENWLAARFGLGADDAPWGALRLLGEGGDPGRAAWLCADPAHLRFARDTLVLAGPRELDLQAAEAAALVDSLNEHLSDAGEFQATAAKRWHLRLPSPTAVNTHPFDRVVGRKVDSFLPDGADGSRWRRVLNEAQMVLHDHPVNRAREQAGKAAVNSLWLWGAGALPAGLPAPAAKLLAEQPLARGLAIAAGMTVEPLPAAARPLLERHEEGALLLLLDQLYLPHLHLDADGWRTAVQALERDWLDPLLAALHAGQLEALHCSGLGDAAAIEVEMQARDRWKFWRRPLSLDRLAPPAAVP